MMKHQYFFNEIRKSTQKCTSKSYKWRADSFENTPLFTPLVIGEGAIDLD